MTKATFKYEAGHEELNSRGGANCPPQGAAGSTLAAFRWVKNPVSAECLLPQALRNPPRYHKASSLGEKCSCWGLSLFTSLTASQVAFEGLERSFKRARVIFGTHVASGLVDPTIGVCTTPDTRGHFDLHEYAAVDLSIVLNSIAGEL